MKQYMVIYFSFMLFYSTLFAEEQNIEKREVSTETSIKVLIEQVKRATVEDRRELMNQLKIRLRAMNKESRKKTMMELRKSFNKKGDSGERHHNLQKQQFRHHLQYRQLQNGQSSGGRQRVGRK